MNERDGEDGRDSYIVPGLVRGLQVLQLFGEGNAPLSLSEIAARIGISRSAAFRTVFTLETHGFLLRATPGGPYRPGPAVLRLGFGYVEGREIADIARPVLESLRSATGWSAHLGMLNGLSVVYVIRLPATGADISIVREGSRLPARATSLGRVLLASLDESELQSRLRTTLQAQDNALAVLRLAKQDRQREWIAHRGDFQRGIDSVATAIRGAEGQTYGAISLTSSHPGHLVPGQRSAPVSRDPSDVLPDLLEAARTISGLLGHQR